MWAVESPTNQRCQSCSSTSHRALPCHQPPIEATTSVISPCSDDPVGELSGRVEARVVTDDEVQVALQVARCPEELVDPPLRPRGDDDLRPRLPLGLDDALAHATGPARNDHPTSTEVRERNLGQILVMHTAYYL